MDNNIRASGSTAIRQVQRAFGMSEYPDFCSKDKPVVDAITPGAQFKTLVLPDSKLTLPDKFSISAKTLLQPDRDFRHDHIAYCARNPSPGSDFDLRHSEAIKKCKSDHELFTYLLDNRFGGTVYSDSDRVAGHVFYQEHARVAHVFSIFVTDDKRGHGLGSKLTLDLIKELRQNCNIKGFRIGKGSEPFVKKFLQRLDSDKWAYSINKVYPEGWVEFVA